VDEVDEGAFVLIAVVAPDSDGREALPKERLADVAGDEE